MQLEKEKSYTGTSVQCREAAEFSEPEFISDGLNKDCAVVRSKF